MTGKARHFRRAMRTSQTLCGLVGTGHLMTDLINEVNCQSCRFILRVKGSTYKNALESAVLRGMRDALTNVSLEDCPYEDKRKPSGLLSWSRAFQNAWRDGWWSIEHDRRKKK